MGAIKRNITDITNLKRGDVQVIKVYRGDTFIWAAGPPPTEAYVVNSWSITNPYYWFENAKDTDSIQITKILELFKL